MKSIFRMCRQKMFAADGAAGGGAGTEASVAETESAAAEEVEASHTEEGEILSFSKEEFEKKLQEARQSEGDKVRGKYTAQIEQLKKEADEAARSASKKTAEEKEAEKEAALTVKELELKSREEALQAQENFSFAIQAMKQANVDDNTAESIELAKWFADVTAGAENPEGVISSRVAMFAAHVERAVKNKIEEKYRQAGREAPGGSTNTTQSFSIGKLAAERINKMQDTSSLAKYVK